MSNSGFFWGRKAGWAREGKKGISADPQSFPVLVKAFSVVDSTLAFVPLPGGVSVFMTMSLTFL
jgi:hypothetical protein